MTGPTTKTRQTREGGTDEAQLGLVSAAVAGGNGPTSTVCKYCGEPDGHHTGQCPTLSFGGAS